MHNVRELTSGGEGEGEDAADDVAKIGLDEGCGLRRFISPGFFLPSIIRFIETVFRVQIQIQVNI